MYLLGHGESDGHTYKKGKITNILQKKVLDKERVEDKMVAKEISHGKLLENGYAIRKCERLWD